MFQKLESLEQRYEELNHLLGDQKILSNPQESQKYGKEQKEIYPLVTHYRRYKEVQKQREETENLLSGNAVDEEFKEMALAEVRKLDEEKIRLEGLIKILLVPQDPYDEKNIFLEIRAGTGGDEAALFASDLFRMYSKYAELHKWKIEILSSSLTGIGGIKEIVASIEGKRVYSRLKFESGVHRVQRVPATEAGGRIHTSTVTVAVLPEAEDVDIQINENDLRIDTFCSSGAGGQSVNTTKSAVRITHIPTGLVVSCQDERSQLKNRIKGMKVLRSRLLEIEKEKRELEIAQSRKNQVGTGERSEKIRTYNFPQNRVTDHRIGFTLHKLESVLEGDLEDLIDALAAWDSAEKLKNV
ncbi:MAG: peptide chain release factor 1 [Nitrospiria bacterium]